MREIFRIFARILNVVIPSVLKVPRLNVFKSFLSHAHSEISLSLFHTFSWNVILRNRVIHQITAPAYIICGFPMF